jgi:hypothetical protein
MRECARPTGGQKDLDARLANPARQTEAVQFAWHLDVGEYQIDRQVRLQHVNGFGRGFCLDNAIATFAQILRDIEALFRR